MLPAFFEPDTTRCLTACIQPSSFSAAAKQTKRPHVRSHRPSGLLVLWSPGPPNPTITHRPQTLFPPRTEFQNLQTSNLQTSSNRPPGFPGPSSPAPPRCSAARPPSPVERRAWCPSQCWRAPCTPAVPRGCRHSGPWTAAAGWRPRRARCRPCSRCPRQCVRGQRPGGGAEGDKTRPVSENRAGGIEASNS
jgi:hypothetical protein